jgi:hypothetical protein
MREICPIERTRGAAISRLAVSPVVHEGYRQRAAVERLEYRVEDRRIAKPIMQGYDLGRSTAEESVASSTFVRTKAVENRR